MISTNHSVLELFSPNYCLEVCEMWPKMHLNSACFLSKRLPSINVGFMMHIL